MKYYEMFVILPLALPMLTACGAADLAAGCLEPKSQTLSEPCCPNHGIDACGATLVCAALDDRTQATCYPEFSQPDNAECSDDRLCASGSCNTEQKRCRASLGAPCDIGFGCAEDPLGFAVDCEYLLQLDNYMCLRKNLQPGVPCHFDNECASNDCYCAIGGVVTCCD